MTLLAVEIVIAMDLHRPEKTLDPKPAASGKPLLGAGLKPSVELIHEPLQHRLEQPGPCLQEPLPNVYFQLRQLLLSSGLVEETLDISYGFFLNGGLDVVAFFFESDEDWARVMATVVSTNCSASFSNCWRPSIAWAKASASSLGIRRVRFRPFSQI